MKKMPMCPNISFLPTPIGEEMKEIIQERLKNGGGASKTSGYSGRLVSDYLYTQIQRSEYAYIISKL